MVSPNLKDSKIQLYTDQLDHIASQRNNYNNQRGYTYVGTKASDQAAAWLKAHSKSYKRPWGMIFNIDPQSKSGKHWIALYAPSSKNNRIEIMDSYGSNNLKTIYAHLPHVQDILSFVNILQMPRLQQMDSFVCGHYCLAFLFFRTCDRTFSHFVRHFNLKKEGTADRLVYKFVMTKMVNKKQRGAGQGNRCAYDCNFCNQ